MSKKSARLEPAHDIALPITPALPARGRIYGSILETIGGTPMVRIPRISAADGLRADVAVKLEFFNPLGSVKDRIGLAMIDEAESRGELLPEQTVVELTSGNCGTGLAIVCAVKDHPFVELPMTDTTSFRTCRDSFNYGIGLLIQSMLEADAGEIIESDNAVVPTSRPRVVI